MAFPLRTLRTLVPFLLGCLAANVGAVVPELAQPGWSQLSSKQRHALAPLAGEWDAMEPYRRKKWLGIASRYDTMNPDEQLRMQNRMRDWARLAPEERRQAREKFKTLQKVSPEQRNALRQNWEDYKALPDAEKKRLQAEAVRRPPTSTLPPATPANQQLRQKIRP